MPVYLAKLACQTLNAFSRNTVPSETCNWDEFTASPVQALPDTSFKKSVSGVQLLVWEMLQLSLSRDMMLPALDNCRISNIMTSIIRLHHDPWLQDPCYCIGLCSSYENKPHTVCSDYLGVILLSFYNVADMHY